MYECVPWSPRRRGRGHWTPAGPCARPVRTPRPWHSRRRQSWYRRRTRPASAPGRHRRIRSATIVAGSACGSQRTCERIERGRDSQARQGQWDAHQVQNTFICHMCVLKGASGCQRNQLVARARTDKVDDGRFADIKHVNRAADFGVPELGVGQPTSTLHFSAWCTKR